MWCQPPWLLFYGFSQQLGTFIYFVWCMILPLLMTNNSTNSLMKLIALLIECLWYKLELDIHTHAQPFYCSSGICLGPPGWAGTKKVKPGRLKPIWFTGARDSEWQWHLLGYMQSAPHPRQPRQHPTAQYYHSHIFKHFCFILVFCACN